MAQVVIDDPILNSPYEEPGSYRLFDDDGIANEIATGRRPSSYFVPIAALKKTGTGNLFMVFGEPDITIAPSGADEPTVEIHGLDVDHPAPGVIRSSSNVVSNVPMGGVGGIAATGQGAETLHTRAEWASLLTLEREE